MDEKTRFPRLLRRVTLAVAIAGVSITLPPASRSYAADPSTGLVVIETGELDARAGSVDSAAVEKMEASQLPILPKVERTESNQARKSVDHSTGKTLADLVRDELSMVPMIRSVEKPAADSLTAPVRLEVAPHVRRIPLGSFGKRDSGRATKGAANHRPSRVAIQHAAPITPPRELKAPPSERLQTQKPDMSTGETSSGNRFDLGSIPAPPTRLTHANTRLIRPSVGEGQARSDAIQFSTRSVENTEVPLLRPLLGRPVEPTLKRVSDRRVFDPLRWDLQGIWRR